MFTGEMYANDVRVIQLGSPLFTFFVPQITHGAGNYWYDLATMLALSGGAGDLRAALDAVLAGRPIASLQRPSLGCNIKWKKGNEPRY